MAAWLTLEQLKNEMDLDDLTPGEGDDERLQRALDAATSFVERVRARSFNFDADPLDERPAPTPDLRLGTMMLARRFSTRRRSPDGLVSMAEGMGSARVASFDPDIDRLLRLGRHAIPRVG